MANVPFKYKCVVETGFTMDPREQKRFGYVTALSGFGLPAALVPDLTVYCPFNLGAASTPAYTGVTYSGPSDGVPVATATVVGVIDEFEWYGGICDPITIDLFLSQENAMQIMMLQQASLKNTHVDTLGWWIADYDQEVKAWFEQSYPQSAATITGHINGKDNPVLDVEPNPTHVKEGVDVNVYKVKIAIVPDGTKTYSFLFASSQMKKVIKPWGIVIAP